MHGFTVKVFKDGKLHKRYKGIARNSSDLIDSALERYFPCSVNVMCDRNVQATRR